MMRQLSYSLALCVSMLAGAAHAGNWNVPTAAKDLKNPVKAESATLKNGTAVYVKHCARCHGDDGAGHGTEQRVDYDLRTILAPLTDGELYWKITHGVGKMPSYAGTLTDEERWLMVNHLKALPPIKKARQ